MLRNEFGERLLLPVFLRQGRSSKRYKAGFIDSEGRIVIEPRFAKAGTFWEGLAPVKIADKWGAIDTNGTIVIEPISELPIFFSEDRADFQVKGKRGVLNQQGGTVVSPRYQMIGM